GKATKAGGSTEDQINGMQNIYQHILQHIQIVAQDENEKQRVVEWQKQLAKLMNYVKAFAQQLQQKQQAQQQSNGGDQETAAKIRAQIITAEAKAKNTRESHAQRTVQKQLQFEQQMKQDHQRHALDMEKEKAQLGFDIARERAKSKI